MTLTWSNPSTVLSPVSWCFTSQLQMSQFCTLSLNGDCFVFSSWYKVYVRDRQHPLLTAPRRSSKKDLKHHRLVVLKFTLHRDSDWAAQMEHCTSVIHSLGQPEATGCLGKSFKASLWLLVLRISRNANETQHKSKHAQVLFSL